MGRKIVVAMINIAVGLFTAYMFIVSDRETKISTTQSNIACEIINLVGCSVRCPEKQMLKSPVKLLI